MNSLSDPTVCALAADADERLLRCLVAPPCGKMSTECDVVSHLRQLQGDLLEQATLLRTVLDESPNFIIVKDHQGRFLLCNRPVAEFYATTPEAMVGKDDADFGAPPELAEFYRRNVQDIMARGETEILFEEARDAHTGEISHFRSIKKPFRGPDGLPRILVIAHDITDIRRAQLQAEESERRLRYALEATGDGVWDWHIPSGRLVLSRRWCELFGIDPSALTGTISDFFQFVPEEVRPKINDMLEACMAGEDHYQNEHLLRRTDGSHFWALDRGKVVERDDHGRAVRMVGSVADITEKKTALDQYRHQAHFDPLTGLLNRTALTLRLEQDMQACRASDRLLALLLLDVDEFKSVNDTLGHGSGDVLLQEAARRLRHCARDSDAICRWGGDEFVLVVGALRAPEEALRVAHQVLRVMAEPFVLGAEQVYVSASIGITLFPNDGMQPEVLLRNADQAMYAAKRAGRNRYCFYTPAMHTSAQEHLRLVTDLRNALPERQFHLVYQPVVDLRSGRITKAEALVRWTHPVRGMVNPAAFIPVVESSGLIHELGDWVFREATRQAARWNGQGLTAFQISVNVSPIQFQNELLNLHAWMDHLRALGLDGGHVVVEITEGLLMEAGPHVSQQLLGFRDAGVQVALDDFGTGYSSLAYLNKFDIDYIKIDRSFVKDLVAGSSVQALCEGIIAMAHKLGLKVVAEGVETEEQLALLTQAECDFGQGYLFSRPVPAEELEALLHHGLPKRS